MFWEWVNTQARTLRELINQRVNLKIGSLSLGSSSDAMLSLQTNALEDLTDSSAQWLKLKGAKQIGLLVKQSK